MILSLPQKLKEAGFANHEICERVSCPFSWECKNPIVETYIRRAKKGMLIWKPELETMSPFNPAQGISNVIKGVAL